MLCSSRRKLYFFSLSNALHNNDQICSLTIKRNFKKENWMFCYSGFWKINKEKSKEYFANFAISLSQAVLNCSFLFAFHFEEFLTLRFSFLLCSSWRWSRIFGCWIHFIFVLQTQRSLNESTITLWWLRTWRFWFLK